MAKKAQLISFKNIAEKWAVGEGSNNTPIPFLSFLKSSEPTSIRYGILRPSLCVVLNGKKKIHIDDKAYEYGAGDFVVSVIDLPTAGQILDVNPKSPYYGLVLQLDIQEVAAIVVEAGIDVTGKDAQGVGAAVGTLDGELLDCVERLLKLLDSSEDAKFFAANIRREIIYRILKSPYGKHFFKNIVTNYQDVGVGRAISWLKRNYNQELVIAELAREANMSVSSLHHKFKSVTTMGPLQYQKQLRLQEARRLMLAGSHDVGSAAFEVGYESPSQFSREYRRLFGESPAQDIKVLRQKQGFEAVQN